MGGWRGGESQTRKKRKRRGNAEGDSTDARKDIGMGK